METMRKLPRIPGVVVKAPVAQTMNRTATAEIRPDALSQMVLENFRKTASRRLRTEY